MSAVTDIKKIIIVGGGSSGWITANLLNARLNDGSGPSVEILLIEAPDIPSIGVGEATVPSIRRTLQTIGVGEKDFMSATDATFKSLIRFKDWNVGEHFDHPFDRRERPGTDPEVLNWLAKREPCNAFAKTFSILSNTADRNLAPKAIGWPEYQSTFPYAYHLDAIKLAAFLTKFGTTRGIGHRLARIEQVNLTEDGKIANLVDQEGQQHRADLYIDCTGFSARLCQKTSPEEISYSNNLLCDSAVTLRVPYEKWRPKHILPYTTATAISSGWVWDTYLTRRRGMGYVYSSQHLDKAAAENELKSFEGAHAGDIEAGHIRFKTYKRTETWKGNCIAIGLSDNFVEPLESSGLYMIQFAAQRLAEDLRAGRQYSGHMSRQFNRLMRTLYEEVVGYVALHYVTSKRRHTEFWRNATHADRIPDSLADLMEIWKQRPPTDTDLLVPHRLFSLESYEYLLFGMGYVSGDVAATGPGVFSLNDALQRCYSKLPLHDDWLAASAT